ncbi:hypothetical protein HOF67_04775 [Candidatus Peregrinibacteria bacterium]|jgi:hypothetical protein|nr:hypothetical protein [Candidatus Peregrinibacteria bacterium]
MQVSFSLKYRKSNFSNRVLIEKEGEIIIYDKGFRLKGKGATDKGELINFYDIKEFYYKDDQLFFITFGREKYTLNNLGTLFDEFLATIYKVRNEFLLDALFMKQGSLKGEFEGYFDRFSKFNKPINKGKCRIRLYEQSMTIIPETQDVFSINFNFINFHEFDEDEYQLKVVMDDGVNIFVSQLGNDFEFFQEKIINLIGGMYGRIVNDDLKEVFCEFDSGTLLKLAYKMRGGKSVSLKDILKMDKDLAQNVLDLFFEDEGLADKYSALDELTDEYSKFFGVLRDPVTKDGFIRWIMYTIPSNNVVAFTILPKGSSDEGSSDGAEPRPHDTYFFRIIMEKGVPSEKVEDKVLEIDQTLVTLRFAKDPCYKDKRELKNSPFKYAIRKLPFLRILRKSYVGRAHALDPKEWKKQAKEIMEKSKLNS